MGLNPTTDKDGVWVTVIRNRYPYSVFYDPLHDDAQAMALVKKFKLDIDYGQGVEWHVSDQHSDSEYEGYHSAMNPDLNRAICECVAKMVNHG